MIFKPSFQWKTWCLSFFPGLFGLCLLVLLIGICGTPSLSSQQEIKIEASGAELQTVLFDPRQFLLDFPVGDGLWCPRKARIKRIQQISKLHYRIFLQGQPERQLDYLCFPKPLEVWILTSEEGDVNLWFRMVKIVPLDMQYSQCIVSIFRPHLTMRQTIEKTVYVQSQMNVVLEDYLYHFKERMERGRRRIS